MSTSSRAPANASIGGLRSTSRLRRCPSFAASRRSVAPTTGTRSKVQPIQSPISLARSFDPLSPLHPTLTSAAGKLRDLPGLIEELLRYQRRGLAVNLIGPVLRGQSHYQAKGGTRKPLWPALIENRFFNTMPTLKRDELGAAMGALAAEGKIVAEGALWWHPAALAAKATDEARRQQRRDQAVAREAAMNARDEASMAQATLGLVP